MWVIKIDEFVYFVVVERVFCIIEVLFLCIMVVVGEVIWSFVFVYVLLVWSIG